MRHLRIAVMSCLILTSMKAFSQSFLPADSCGFSKTEVAKKIGIINHVIVADLNCSLSNPQDRPKYVQWGNANMSERKSLYDQAEAFFEKKEGSSCMKGKSANIAYSNWTTYVMNAQSNFVSVSSENRRIFCAQAVEYIDQRLKSGKTVVSLETQDAPIQLATVNRKFEAQFEKPVRREQTAAVAVASSSSYRRSGSLSGPSSLAYTSAYSNLLPTSYQQPMFIQSMVNQIIFIPGVGYRSVLRPVVVPLRPGVY